MKNTIYKLALAITSLSFLGGCVDKGLLEYAVEKPESIAQYEYLNAYSPLKSYVDRAASPGFTLGSGITVSEFLQHGLVYSLATTNFDIITAGNAMKYASVVADNGSMDFSTISEFVELSRKGEIAIYGHTLCWHSQQNNTYLNGLIADKVIEIDPDASSVVEDAFVDYSQYTDYPFYKMTELTIINDEGQLEVTNEEELANWQLQYFVADGVPAVVGNDYEVTALIRGTSDGYLQVNMGDWGANSSTFLSFTSEWQEVTVTLQAVPASSCFVVFQSGGFNGTLQVQWVKVTHKEAMASSWWTNLVTNSSCEDPDVSSFYATELTDGPKAATIGAAGTGADGIGKSIVVKTGDNPTNSWDSQFFVVVDHKFQEGDKYQFSMMVKADKPAMISSQAHSQPGDYLHWQMVGSPNVTTEWQEYTTIGTIAASQAGMSTIAFNLNELAEANTYYFDDIRWEIEESGNSIPMTPEEKKEVLTAAMDSWVKGMMEACDGYVTQWDVVNEVVSGADYTGDGTYDLWSTDRVSAEDAAANFYWRDYLGDYDVVRLPIKLARHYFAENGGAASDLKLFVNDYNLESDWDDNRKLKSLLAWINRWESDGVTVIDGIGSQMHVSCYEDPAAQARKEEHVVKMLELMAASGKLVRITELDMGYVDANGTTVMTANMTFDQHLKMAEYYTFIVQKYKEIIPITQQSGITHWCPTDSPEGSGWRKGQPVGLWTLDYTRKPAYGAIADGLSK